MKQPFKGQEVSYILSENLDELTFTVHDARRGSTVQDASALGSNFAYSVLGVAPHHCHSNGGWINDDGSVTAKFRV